MQAINRVKFKIKLIQIILTLVFIRLVPITYKLVVINTHANTPFLRFLNSILRIRILMS